MIQTALPSPLQTAALDVCINADDRAFDSWRRHIGTGADARILLGRSDARIRRLVSLLYTRFRETDIALEKSLLTWFRTAAVREQLRGESVAEICAGVLASLHEAGVAPIVVNGVAMASSVYPEASARHCHDLDLLLTSGEAVIAKTALLKAGFSVALPRPRTSPSTVSLSHASGFGVALHRVPYRVRAWNGDAIVAGARTVAGNVAGHSVRLFASEDSLVRIMCNGLSAGSRHSPSWALDAALLIRTRDLDWDEVAANAKSCGRGDTVLTGLEYLEHVLRVDVPKALLEDLRVETFEAIAPTVEAARLSAYGSRLGLIRRSRRADILRTAAWALGARMEST